MVRPKRASVSSVPVYDSKVYSKPRKGRSKHGDYAGFDLSPSVRTAQTPGRRRSSSQGTRRVRIQSPRSEIQISQIKVEAAAKAFLDIFGQLKLKVIKSLWKRSPETEEKGNVRILHTSRQEATSNLKIGEEN